MRKDIQGLSSLGCCHPRIYEVHFMICCCWNIRIQVGTDSVIKTCDQVGCATCQLSPVQEKVHGFSDNMYHCHIDKSPRISVVLTDILFYFWIKFGSDSSKLL